MTDLFVGEAPRATILPLGDAALLVRFGSVLNTHNNAAAVRLARRLQDAPIAGVIEVSPNLVSVTVRYDPRRADIGAISGELRMAIGVAVEAELDHGSEWTLPVCFDGEDLAQVADALALSPEQFVEAHNRQRLRVLATGFAPGFVYCGMHDADLALPRRSTVRSAVPAGSVLFAAGQTAITATEMPTGWHLIGHTRFRNFDPHAASPTTLSAGDTIRFKVEG
jgi:KipI family sensor histidine kinase inhibitor